MEKGLKCRVLFGSVSQLGMSGQDSVATTDPRGNPRRVVPIDILSVDGASTLLPIGADVSRGRHLGVVIRSTQCHSFGRNNDLHLINLTSLNATDFHTFFVKRVAMIKDTCFIFFIFYYCEK